MIQASYTVLPDSSYLEWIGVQESQQEVTKNDALVKMVENPLSVSSHFEY